VWLTVTDALAMVPWGVYLPSAVTGAIASGPLGAMGPQSADAVIMSQTDVANARAEAALFTLTTAAFDASGAQVGAANSTQSLAPGGTARLFLDVPVQNASLWNTESPYLYTVRSTLWVGGSAVDEVLTRIGIRSAVWSPTQGFQLNGFKLPLQGFSNHQSFAGCGNAVPSRVDAFRVAKLRSLGANLWRGSYPTSSELLDHADRLGMLVWEENRLLQYVVQPVQGRQQRGSDDQPLPPDVAIADPQLLRDAQDMVLRDRNRPSVVIWCACPIGGAQMWSPQLTSYTCARRLPPSPFSHALTCTQPCAMKEIATLARPLGA
jgi:beta-galactosidase